MEKCLYRLLVTTITVVCAFACTAAMSRATGCQKAAAVIGKLQTYKVGANESLIEVARKYDLGFNAIAAANPGVDPWIPSAGSLIDLPTSWILPDMPILSGIVINIPELRLYYFSKKTAGTVVTFPLGIGDQGRGTPVGSYQVTEKIVRPAWHVPASMRSEDIKLPKVVPPGPDNPLGSHALRLSRAEILIHGTNRPWGIGRRSSHGCLRLYPEDIVKLFNLVPRGTRVTVVNQPIKACVQGDRIFVEVHRPESGDSSVGRALHLLADKNLLARTDFAKLVRAMEEMKGMPVDITLTGLD